MHDVALLHVAALLDPDIKGYRLQAWAEPANWNDLLAVLRRLCPGCSSIPADLPNPSHIELTTDTTDCVRLLKRWSRQDGFKTMNEAIRDTLDHWGLLQDT